MIEAFRTHLRAQLDEIERSGLTKRERVIASAQDATVTLLDGREVLNMCANNYLGLADHPEVLAAARAALEERGAGMASVRFICGTQDRHRELEQQLAAFLGCEDAILFPSAFDANGGVFETLLGKEDAVVSDALNHASIIDGIRLCRAQRLRYANRDLDELEARLREAREGGARHVLIATDGVFSMDGLIAPLREICDLADRYEALVMVDDCHATGFLGASGRGTHEHAGCADRVDVLTGTLGKALGGASGGYVAGAHEVVALLRQRARPYLFSNAVAPPVVAASRRALELAAEDPELRRRLWDNTTRFRAGLDALGLTVLGDVHPITPVLLGDAHVAGRFAERLLDHGIYAVAFSYPVVPHETARIRTQLSAAHTPEQLDRAVAAFGAVARELELIA
ncbi:MAG TPA: glycine C-acetyltransferase [Conexibacter sp.]|nr:glycine C-acetyltransferase [Conexibacter sp.]